VSVYEGFVQSTYQSTANVLAGERSINVMVEKTEIPNAKSPAALVHTPGLSTFATLPTGPVWALWNYPTSSDLANGHYLHAVAGPNNGALHIYRVTSGGVVTDMGAFPLPGASSLWGRVYPPKVVGDQQRLLTVGGGLTYPCVYTFAAAAAPVSVASTYPGTSVWTAANIDTYFFSSNNALLSPISTLCASNPNDPTTWNALNILASQDGPDLIMELASLRREMWVLGTNKTSVYYDAGNPSFPFSRVQGAVSKVGCLAPRSVVEMNGSLYFLGTEAPNLQNAGNGLGAIYRTNGYNVQRISTYGIEQLLATWTNPDLSMAFTYQDQGHRFYVLNGASGSTANGCIVFDETTGACHERSSPWTTNTCYAGQCYSYAFGKHLVGSAVDGKILQLATNTYTDNGSAITRTRIGPPIATENLWNFYHRFTLDCQVGTQASGNQTVTLYYSNDGGMTWSSGTARTVSTSGNYTGRAVWLRLGKARNRVFKLTTTDQMPITWLQAFIDAEAGYA
jgi:hypothetical protein